MFFRKPLADSSGGNTLQDNVISGNGYSGGQDASQSGVYLNDADDNTIQNNKIGLSRQDLQEVVDVCNIL